MFTVATFAQVTTGNLQGVVADPNGAVVSGATVKLTNTETGQIKEAVTNTDGNYTFVSLLSGEHYKLDVSAKGFATRTVFTKGLPSSVSLLCFSDRSPRRKAASALLPPIRAKCLCAGRYRTKID